MENKKGKTIKEASIIELKAECFDINGQIKMLQRKNQEIVDELNFRYSEMKKQELDAKNSNDTVNSKDSVNIVERKKDGITKN